MTKKIRVGSNKVQQNKDGSRSIKVRTSKSTWKTVQKVKPIRSK